MFEIENATSNEGHFGMVVVQIHLSGFHLILCHAQNLVKPE